MCGRFRYRGKLSEADELKHIPGVEIKRMFPPRYNIAPTQLSPVIRATKDGGHEVEALRWGLVPYWARDLKIGNQTINARSETVPTKPAFRAAFKSRRCLVLSHGFYEWETTATGKQPWLFSLPGEALMVFASGGVGAAGGEGTNRSRGHRNESVAGDAEDEQCPLRGT